MPSRRMARADPPPPRRAIPGGPSPFPARAPALGDMGSFFDDVDTVFRHGLAGLVAARDDLAWDDRGFIRRAGEGASESAPEGAGPGDARDDGTRPGRVALVSGGGSGHEPLHAGFIGAGMLDAVCPRPPCALIRRIR